ncbi:MAG: GNAT family N-acetyltransferase [Actinomycetota bacterium]
MFQIKRVLDGELNLQITSNLRELLDVAFEGDFSEEDWLHTFGGFRFLGYLDGKLIAHGAVVLRNMKVDGREIQVGYVEGVAVLPMHWRKGFGSLLMSEITSYCSSEFQLSMLSTGDKHFYRKHGWLDFSGESYVLKNGVEIRTLDEDEGLMFLVGVTGETSRITKAVCESRVGDHW